MSRPIVALDLDDTLLKNRAMIYDIWRVVAHNFPDRQIDPDLAYDELQKYYKTTAPTLDMKAYDFDAHLRDCGVDVGMAYDAVRCSELADGRHQVDGLEDFLTDLRRFADMLVVTYGYDDYQRLKASLCPALQNVEIITTLDSKSVVLKKRPEVDFMIDDRLVPDLPDSVQFVMVSLVGKPIDSQSPPVFTSLKDVGDYLYEQMH